MKSTLGPKGMVRSSDICNYVVLVAAMKLLILQNLDLTGQDSSKYWTRGDSDSNQ